jgi:hypothetical protein
MKNTDINEIIGALCVLEDALKDYDTELSHNILIGGGCDCSEEKMEEDLEEYLGRIEQMKNKLWQLKEILK